MPNRPRRSRRRRVPRSSLPRPTRVATGELEEGAAASALPRRPLRVPQGPREHHITTDYGYVRKDLVAIAVVSAITFGFVVGMSFVL